MRSRQCITALAGFCLALSVAGISRACDTPVYRYAMYQWPPAPYELYLFHEKPLSDADRQVWDAIDRLSADPRTGANLAMLDVDIAADPEMRVVSPFIKSLREKTLNEQGGDASLPLYLLVSPHGGDLQAGTLSAEDAKTLLESPARRAIAERLQQGDACVLVLLSGLKSETEPADSQDDETSPAESSAEVEDGKATDAAEQQLKQLVENVNSGKVELYSPPPRGAFGVGNALPGSFGRTGEVEAGRPRRSANDDSANEEAADEKPPAARHTISYIKVSRTDPAEQWLVRSLLAVEPDLLEIPHPMVFAVYGRGRAMPPYIGAGIEPNNLLEVVEYVTGACSCTVKEQNPGMDLLMRNDWETAAEMLAERFGAEEGNEAQFGDDALFSTLVIPTAAPEKMLAENATDVEPNKPSEETDNAPLNPETASSETSAASDSVSETQPDASASESASASTSTVNGSGAGAPTSYTVPVPVYTVDYGPALAIGVLVGLVALAVVTLVVVRSK